MDESCVVIRQQEAIGVYENEYGEIVIHQINPLDDDSRIFVNKDNVERLIMALSAMIGGQGNV